jgi:hypothetical protein
MVGVRLSRLPEMRGQVVWIPADQGGRTSGPPNTPPDSDYAATAFVPPHAEPASFVLRVADRTGWTSPAEAAWLVERDDPRWAVEPGTVVVVTEGARPVARFTVESVTPKP